MNEISNEKINLLVDTFEECAMMYFDATTNELYENTDITNYRVERPHTNFYECLLKIEDYFLDEKEFDEDIEEKILEQIKDKINDLRDYISVNGINSEEVRRALLLLDIKGFKNLNFPLDLITPDAMGILCNEIVNAVTDDLNKITILDPNFGVGNLAFTIAVNQDKDVHLIGFDNHELMARVAASKANMIQVPLDIYHEDCLNYLPSGVDVMVSDVASYEYEIDGYNSRLHDNGVNYFPYLLIEHFLNLSNEVKFVLLIDNDFFSQPSSAYFKEALSERGNILCLISLPPTFFIEGESMKSILVMDNKPSRGFSTEIYSLPPLSDRVNFIKVINEIKTYLKNN